MKGNLFIPHGYIFCGAVEELAELILDFVGMTFSIFFLFHRRTAGNKIRNTNTGVCMTVVLFDRH